MVKLVTPVAQALEIAKSELAREVADKKANEPTKYRENVTRAGTPREQSLKRISIISGDLTPEHRPLVP